MAVKVWKTFAGGESSIAQDALASAQNRASMLFSFFENIIATLHLLCDYSDKALKKMNQAGVVSLTMAFLARVSVSTRSGMPELVVPWSLIAMTRTY
jgi:hypothetical protein